jgi:enoyl-CoA hydratase/carnithine racemase
MEQHVITEVKNQLGIITLDRAPALNSLSLAMVRDITRALLTWRDDANITAVVMRSNIEKAFCAGGDIRFFYQKGSANAMQGGALIEDFFTEEYALNHLVHHYPKPYIAFMDGIVMGGGMGIAQAGPTCRLRIVTERTKMAMPEVAIGLFPDVGGGYFLSRATGVCGTYLGVTGETIAAADAIYADLADVFIPSSALAALLEHCVQCPANKDIRHHIKEFAANYYNNGTAGDPASSRLVQERTAIDQHFSHNSVEAILESLKSDSSEFAQKTLAVMQKRSPLMMSVTLEQIRRSQAMSIEDCLRMERNLVRRCFEHGEVIEGVRALVIDKDHQPKWNPSSVAAVNSDMVQHFFEPAWPEYAHPLKNFYAT